MMELGRAPKRSAVQFAMARIAAAAPSKSSTNESFWVVYTMLDAS